MQKRIQALTCFFVFNPTLGDEMHEEERILYFYPTAKHMPVQIQSNFIGLVSGLVNFSNFGLCIYWVDLNRDFSHLPANSLHTEHHRFSFCEVEKDIWFALALKNPRYDNTYDLSSTGVGGQSQTGSNANAETKGNNTGNEHENTGGQAKKNPYDKKRVLEDRNCERELDELYSEEYMEEDWKTRYCALSLRLLIPHLCFFMEQSITSLQPSAMMA
ncbi:hypothetical protein RFI_09920 [Reticulomyxa filosa]|uniref:CCZ1/INTU/HSP4 first Longin domain-containing protein n=1 Tax=Reticulomyxa filosa TaxID=46433 RepID=X6NNB6_RETFI|nr:hypothetical protein RFI_09920 [Reticulomyxa filosa]|eukprot:ETO27214.1 hypothetical protein RFI_09920 [Reticulomyxa filosa]